jgi:hypothetical protein
LEDSVIKNYMVELYNGDRESDITWVEVEAFTAEDAHYQVELKAKRFDRTAKVFSVRPKMDDCLKQEVR